MFHNTLLTTLLTKITNFMAPFYGRGSTASRLEPLRRGSLLNQNILSMDKSRKCTIECPNLQAYVVLEE